MTDRRRDRARRAHDAARAHADDLEWPRILDANRRLPANNADRTWTRAAESAPPPAEPQPIPDPDVPPQRVAARHAARRAFRIWHWPALMLVGLAATWTLSSVALGDEPPSAGATSPAAVGCDAPQPLRALYVRGDKQPDRRAQALPAFRTVTAQIDALLERTGMRSAGRPTRFARDESCAVIIQSVVVPQASMANAASIGAALRTLGLDNPGERYMYWYDAPGCGMAPGNRRADSTDPGPGFAGLGTDCWNLQASTRELLRALGQ